eukprot:11312412-Alexandrium_andersonii.AAC.1
MKLARAHRVITRRRGAGNPRTLSARNVGGACPWRGTLPTCQRFQPARGRGEGEEGARSQAPTTAPGAPG